MFNDLQKYKLIVLNNNLELTHSVFETQIYNKEKYTNLCNNKLYDTMRIIENLYLLNNFKIKPKDITRYKFNVNGFLIMQMYSKSINKYISLIRSDIFLYDIMLNQENYIIKKFRERTPVFIYHPRIECNGEIFQIDENSEFQFIITINICVNKIDYEKIKKTKLKTMYQNIKDDSCLICYNKIDTTHINNKVCKNGHCVCDICFTQIEDKIQCCYCKKEYKN